MTINNEGVVTRRERQIALNADKVFAEAYISSLDTGLPVLVAKGNSLVEVYSDGREVFKRMVNTGYVDMQLSSRSIKLKGAF